MMSARFDFAQRASYRNTQTPQNRKTAKPKIMKRRDFLKNTTLAGAALPHFIPGFGGDLLATSPWAKMLAKTANEYDRALVLIRLDGGNDGLNTLVPMNQYAKLNRVRPKVILPENSLLSLGDRDDLSFHPAMTGMLDLYNQGRMKIVQSVGYPHQDFSHFRSSDIWMTGANSDEVLSTGWAGRYLHQEYPDYPGDYPNETMPDPLSLEIGATLSLTLQGPFTSMGMSIYNPEEFYELVGNVEDPLPNTPAGELLGHVRTIQRQSNLYGNIVTEAYERGRNMISYNQNNDLANQLKIVARLISGGLRTPIYLVSIGGFDTHDSQVDPSDHTKGEHANLLERLSGAVSEFMTDIKQQGFADRVLAMTFSEFGRRIISNDSYGTDHGAAAPLFLFGEAVEGGVLGDNPTIPGNATWEDNLPMQYDFRSVYASVLKDWFCVPDNELSHIFYRDYQTLPLLSGTQCIPSSVRERQRAAQKHLVDAWPNPFTDRLTILFQGAGQTLLQVFNSAGQLVDTLVNGRYEEGDHLTSWDSGNMPVGHYHLRLQMGEFQQVKTILKVK
jgi:uncharacterized protein (DUF1501 family)